MIPVILASRSPRRRRLLNLVNVPHVVVPSGVAEERLPGEDPASQVVRLATAKAEFVAREYNHDSLVIGADTLVVYEGEPIGQPLDAKDAAAMLRKLSGATHTVLTGVCLLRGPSMRAVGLSESRVTFHDLSEGEIDWYLTTGEPMDKAGAYAAQGLGAIFLKAIEGSFHNVVGFPLDLFYRLLPQVGCSLEELRSGRRKRAAPQAGAG